MAIISKTAAQWDAAKTTVLAAGDVAYETDTYRRKIGDGVRNWEAIGYELLFRPRRGTNAQWLAKDPVVGKDEFVVESDTKRHKFGDGVKTYSELPYGDEAAMQRIDALEQENAHLLTKLAQQEAKVNELWLGKSNYCVGGWSDDNLAPELIERHGSVDFALDWHVYLLDVTRNAGVATVPVGELQKNNLTRFIDGSYAPTIGITEAQRAECDIELYLANGTKYCDAGAFDPAVFFENHPWGTKLFNSEGTEVRILRPWETTSTDYTIGIGRNSTIYVLDNVKGKSGKRWRGIFSEGGSWDGIDLSSYSLPPTVFSMGAATQVGTSLRNFFFDYASVVSNCNGQKGEGGICTIWNDIYRHFPRTSIGAQDIMKYARNVNADVTKSYPFAEGGYFTLNAFIIAMEVAYGTKDLHKDAYFGSGISSDDSCSNESTYLYHGGFRYRVSGTDNWSYTTWNASCNIYKSTPGTKFYVYNMVNNQYPKEQCMESQMIASLITSLAEPSDLANGVIHTTQIYGGTYYYENIPIATTVADGQMNIRLYRKMSQTISAYDVNGDACNYDIECIERMSLIQGVRLSGDIFINFNGGLDNVATILNETSGGFGNLIEQYVQINQMMWHYDDDVAIKKDGSKYALELAIPKVGEFKTVLSGYASKRRPYDPFATTFGGGLHSGECSYTYINNYWSTGVGTKGNRVRIGSRFGGNASHGTCAPRYVIAFYAFSTTSQAYGCSWQALVSVTPTQSE